MRVHDDTDIGGAAYRFPPTRRSAIVAAGSADEPERTWALEVLVAAYWKPVYKYIRLRWHESSDAAKDFTQGFFTLAIEKQSFRGYDPSKASFRTFLRSCIDHFMANERKFASRQKRAGDAHWLELDFDAADTELASAASSIADRGLDEYFQKEWVASLFAMAVDRIQQECLSSGKTIHFQLFEQYDLAADSGGPSKTYAQLAAEFGIAPTDVTNYLAWTRRQFRRIVLETLRQITGSDREFRAEARLLLGVDPS